jgi:hypothetical protein
MLLYKVRDGFLIEFFSQKNYRMQIAIKNKSQIIPGVVPLTTIRHYFLLDDNISVFPLCKVEEYESGVSFTKNKDIELKKSLQLKKVEPGTLAQINNNLSEKETILITEHKCYNSVVVAALDSVLVIPYNTPFKELGPAFKYNGLKDFKTSYRVCPNCNKFTLIEINEEVSGYNCVNECLNCKNRVAICWKKEI